MSVTEVNCVCVSLTCVMSTMISCSVYILKTWSVSCLHTCRDASILEGSDEEWKPLVLVFEEPDSYVGQKVRLQH